MAIQPETMPAGYELPPLTKSLTIEKMRFFTWRFGEEPSIHTNDDMAREAGLPAPIAQGTMFLSYVSEMMAKAFRQRWVESGKLSVSFINPVFAGDTVTVRGVVKGKVAEADATRLVLDIWVEKQTGDKTMVGEASVIV